MDKILQDSMNEILRPQVIRYCQTRTVNDIYEISYFMNNTTSNKSFYERHYER